MNHSEGEEERRCAILFYGLPRSFLTMTLPSVIEHVILPNVAYDCHYFINYHYLTHEPQGRSGYGGTLDPNQVLMLEEALWQVKNKLATFPSTHSRSLSSRVIIRFSNFTEAEFWNQNAVFLNKTRMTYDRTNSHLLYVPQHDKSITLNQTDNIVRMWHSQMAAWTLLEQAARELQVNYTRVAMMRSDVLFLSPIDLWLDGRGTGTLDETNRVVVVPAFAKAPVNDRTYEY